MKKYTLSFAFLALAAFMAFLAACGEGEIVNLAGSAEQGQIMKAVDDFVTSGIIKDCGGKEGTGDCPSINQPSVSSSSEGEEPDPGGKDDSSSSKGDVPPEPPSSASPPPQADIGENCPDAETRASIQSKFTCSWDPSSLVSGDESTLKMAITDQSCEAGKAWKQLQSGLKKDYAYFTVNEKVTAAGIYTNMKNNGTGLDDAAKSWPTSGSFVVNGLLKCNEYACSKECEPLTIMKADEPTKTSGNISCPWTYLSPTGSTKNPISIGTTLAACDVSTIVIGNKDFAKCGNVTYELEGSTAAQGTVKGLAVTTCRGTKYRVDSVVATVVPNPSRSACTWTANGTTLTGNSQITNTAKTIKPNATLSNSYGRCKVGTTTLTDGALPVNAFGGTGANTWPTDGKLTISTDTDYLDINSKVDCGTSPAINVPTCPALKVKVGCTTTIDKHNIAVSVQNGECFDVDYTATGSENNRANGMYVICSTGKITGSSTCIRFLEYSSGSQSVNTVNAGACNEEGNNVKTSFLIQNSQNFSSGKKFSLEGITPTVYTNLTLTNYFNIQCLGNNWQEGAVYLPAEYCPPDGGQALLTQKPNVTFPSSSLATSPGITCKIKSGDNNW